MICLEGEGSFVFNGKAFRMFKNNILVTSTPSKIKNLAAPESAVFEWFAAPNSFLGGLLPANNYSIGGSISLNANPIIPLSDADAEQFLADIHRIRERMDKTDLRFYDGIMGSLCLTMIYDIFEFHAKYYGATEHTERAGYIVRSLMDLLSSGICRTEREMSYYAGRLNVSPKYLSALCKKHSGKTANEWITEHVLEDIRYYLKQTDYSIKQICHQLGFPNTSFFGRYVKIHFGMTPMQIRME